MKTFGSFATNDDDVLRFLFILKIYFTISLYTHTPYIYIYSVIYVHNTFYLYIDIYCCDYMYYIKMCFKKVSCMKERLGTASFPDFMRTNENIITFHILSLYVLKYEILCWLKV